MRLSLIKYGNIVLTIITTPLHQYPLYRWSVVPLGGYIVNPLDCYSYRIIGKLTVFFAASGVQLEQSNRGHFHFRRADLSSKFLVKVGSTLVKTEVLRVNLNIDGVTITSRTHTHPSHSESSRLLTSSLSLGVPVPRPTEWMWGFIRNNNTLTHHTHKPLV